MKLLNTIQHLINEAENNLYDASLKNNNPIEIEELEKRLDESFELLKLFNKK